MNSDRSAPTVVPADAGKQSMTAIDTHGHIYEQCLKLAPSGNRSSTYDGSYKPTYDALLSEYVRQMDANGVSHGVLVHPNFLGTDNSYLVAALRRMPDRLRGIAIVDTSVADSELAELDSAGVVGIRPVIGDQVPDFRSAAWKALLRKLASMRWQVEIHCEARHLPKIVDPLLESGVDVVIDHFGRPDPKLGVKDPGFQYLLSAAASRRVWVKLSGAYRAGPKGVKAAGDAVAREAVPSLHRAFGPERLLWGSDWPHIFYENVVSFASVRADLDTWITDPAERWLILCDTPAKLFRFSLGAANISNRFAGANRLPL